MSKRNTPKETLICVAAGKSGGHLIPALELARREITAETPGSVLLASNATALDHNIATSYPFISHTASFHFTTFHKNKIWLLPVIVAQLIFAFFSCVRLFWRRQPNKVITTGGFVAIPVCMAAWISRIPIYLYELNVEPGKASCLVSFFARRIGIVFEETRHHFASRFLNRSSRCELTAYPVRFPPSAAALPPADGITILNEKTRPTAPFSLDRKTILLLGGSQGSAFLNQAMKNLIEQCEELHDQIQVIHQTGASMVDEYRALYARLSIPAIVFAFSQDIATHYAVADLVICRAGAGTLFELLFFSKRTLVVPLVTSTTGHQIFNAQSIAQQHPALFTLLYQNDLEQQPFLLAATVAKLLQKDCA